MARRLPPLGALRAFEAAARHVSFSRAAEELNVTQAAISHQVKQLEGWLGAPLFRRLTRSLRLTDEGQALMPAVSQALDRLEQAVERIAASGVSGTLTVSALTTFVLTWLVPRLSRFQAAYPELDVRLSATQRLVDFAREDVDVAIRHGDGTWPGVRADRLFAEQITPLCGRAFQARLTRPADLLAVPLLQSDGLGDAEWPLWFAAAGVAHPNPRRGPAFDSTKIAVEAAIDGLGVAIGAPALFADALAQGRLFQPFDLTVSTGKAYWLVSPEATAERPKVRAFRDWVLAELAADVGALRA
jgi:DNA-binding transcriptional LysR family regulator